MLCIPQAQHQQRPRHMPPMFPACVVEPVKRKDIDGNPKAVEARNAEAQKLRQKKAWLEDTVREWDEVAREAKRNAMTIHIDRIFGIMVVKNSELPHSDPRRKFKY